MMSKFIMYGFATVILAVLVMVLITPAKTTNSNPYENQELIKRGGYLVTIGGCNDCHTPLMLTEQGLEFDMSRMLSGYPANVPLPKIPWFNYRHLTDEGFTAVYAYLLTVKPIRNPVPEPIIPPHINESSAEHE